MSKDGILRNIKSLIGPAYRRVVPYAAPYKGSAELTFWKKEYEREGGKFENSWYRKNVLAMAREDDDTFLSNKIVADFGCGPRGSLEWATSAKERIGIDVLANAYIATFNLSKRIDAIHQQL